MGGRDATPAWQRAVRRSSLFRVLHAGHTAVLRRALLRRSRPMPSLPPGSDGAPRHCVVVAPHPDDEVLGCGALMRRRVGEGAQVTVVVVTDGRHSHRSSVIGPDELAACRRQESLAACGVLGVSDVRFLDVEERTLAGDDADVTAALVAVLQEVAPVELLLPCARDGHPDHVACNQLGLEARRRAAATAVCYEYPIWFWDASAWARPGRQVWRKALEVLVGPWLAVRGRPLYRVGVGDGNGPGSAPGERVDRPGSKAAAIAEYRSQTTNLTGEADWAVFDRRFLAGFVDHDELFFGEAPV